MVISAAALGGAVGAGGRGGGSGPVGDGLGRGRPLVGQGLVVHPEATLALDPDQGPVMGDDLVQASGPEIVDQAVEALGGDVAKEAVVDLEAGGPAAVSQALGV